MFEKLQKELDEIYSDDARFKMERREGKLYFLYSDHHQGELYVVIADETPDIYQAIEDFRHADFNKNGDMTNEDYGGLQHCIEAVLSARGFVVN